MLRRMGERAGIELDVEKAVNAPYRLDQFYVAASRAIARKLDLPYDREPAYVGREVEIDGSRISLLEPKTYDPEELAVAFYDLYRRVDYRVAGAAHV
jgi:hypothetical protein